MADQIDLDAQSFAGFVVYRPDGSAALDVSGSAVTAEVQFGSLVIKSGNEVRYILSPGQWATVNHRPG